MHWRVFVPTLRTRLPRESDVPVRDEGFSFPAPPAAHRCICTRDGCVLTIMLVALPYDVRMSVYLTLFPFNALWRHRLPLRDDSDCDHSTPIGLADGKLPCSCSRLPPLPSAVLTGTADALACVRAHIADLPTTRIRCARSG